jgi:uncharacterized protein YPO0396
VSEDVSLKEYIERQCALCQKNTQQRFDDREDAISLARQEIDRRLSDMNELRKQIESERGSFIHRDIFDRMHGLLETRVHALEMYKSNMDGRFIMLGGMLLAAQIAMGIVLHFLK